MSLRFWGVKHFVREDVPKLFKRGNFEVCLAYAIAKICNLAVTKIAIAKCSNAIWIKPAHHEVTAIYRLIASANVSVVVFAGVYVSKFAGLNAY